MTIRIATHNDAESVSSLVIAASTPHRAMDFDEAGWQWFVQSNDLSTTRARLDNDEYFTLCSVDEGAISGIITVRNFRKIDQLYVLPAQQRRGTAQALWHAAHSHCREQGYGKRYSVRSSTYAVPVYQRFGFYVVGGRRSENGVTYTLMEYGHA